MKTNPPPSFERTLWVHWFQFLSYTAQDVEHGKGIEVEKRKTKGHWKFSSLDAIQSKNPPKFNMDSFSSQKSLDIVF